MIKLTVKKGGGNSSFINNRVLKPIAGFAKTTQLQVKTITEFNQFGSQSIYINRFLTFFDQVFNRMRIF